MKIILKNISLLFFFELILFSYSTVYAQNEPITDYLKSTIYYSPIYNGQIEPGYSHHLYKNYPYYLSGRG